jgi:hypothetical protein
LNEAIAQEELGRLVAESNADNAKDPGPLNPGPKSVKINKRL